MKKIDRMIEDLLEIDRRNWDSFEDKYPQETTHYVWNPETNEEEEDTSQYYTLQNDDYYALHEDTMDIKCMLDDLEEINGYIKKDMLNKICKNDKFKRIAKDRLSREELIEEFYYERFKEIKEFINRRK